MRLAVGDIKQTFDEQHCVWARELAHQRIRFRAVSLHPGPQDRGDNSGLEIDSPDGVTFCVRNIEAAVGSVGESLRAGTPRALARRASAEGGLESWAAIAGIAGFPCTVDAM